MQNFGLKMLKNAKNDPKFLFLTIKSPKNVISTLVTCIWTKKSPKNTPIWKFKKLA